MFKKFALSLLFLLILGCGQENTIVPSHTHNTKSKSAAEIQEDIVKELNIIMSDKLADGIRNRTIFDDKYNINRFFKFKHIIDRNEEYHSEWNLLIIKVSDRNEKDVWIQCFLKIQYLII